MTQLLIKHLPEGYVHASKAKKVELDNEMLRMFQGQRIVFLNQNAVLKNYTNRGLASRSIAMIKNGNSYLFNMYTNNDLNSQFNQFTNSIKFY